MRREDQFLVINNMEIYNYYRDRLISMALSQFEWMGLPETCDPLYFERKLLFQGTAALLQPTGTDVWLSLPYVFRSNFNGYGYPLEIAGVDFNGAQIESDNFIIFYDNVNTQRGGNCGNLMPKIELYAKEMWKAHMTYHANLDKQINPYIVTGSKKMSKSIINVMNRVFGYQPVIQLRTEDDIKKFKTWDMKVPYIGNDLLLTLKTLWAEALSMLGIASGTTKRERQGEMELILNRQESAIMANSRLLTRVQAINQFNKVTGLNASVNMVAQDLDFRPYQPDLATEILTNEKEKGVS